MSFQRIALTALLGALPVLGCASSSVETASDDGDVGEVGQAVMEPTRVPIVSTNGLPPGLLVDGTAPADLAALADGAIGARTPLANTDAGRKLLGYLARCAIPQDSSFLSVDSQGNGYLFQGLLGLAPDWLSARLGASDRGWVSACMLAHANAYGTHADIVLRGTNPAIADEPPAGFVAQEAGFYGDIFGAQAMSACVGYSPSLAGTSAARVCGRTTACGFTIEGTCMSVVSTPICTGGPDLFSACTSTTLSGTVSRQEVITVFTQPGTFDLGHTCSHSPLVRGWPLGKSCSSVITAVCSSDAYCCETDWDDGCVAAAKQLTPGQL